MAAGQEPNPIPLKMKVVDGETRHIADGRGAINRHGQLVITVDRLASKSLTAVATGTYREHNLYSDAGYSSDEETTWMTTWTGRWQISGQTMTLDLVLTEQQCKKIKTWSGQPPQAVPCRAASKQTQLVCTTEQVLFSEDNATLPEQRPMSIAAWICRAPSLLELGETPSQWVLGKTTCLQSSGPRLGSGLFRKCAP